MTAAPLQTASEVTRDMESLRKLRSRREAEFALAGWLLSEQADGSFVAGRWGMASTPLRDLDEVEVFARRAGIRIELA